jgi:tetratricopeptide (TPR) repeat protein
VLLVSLLLRLGFNQSRGHSADGGSPQPSDNGRVAVLPFETRGMSDSTQAGNALSELLTVALELAGELRPINQAAVLTELKRGAESTEAAARNTVAATLGADLIVTGSVVEVAGRLRIAATMWRIGADGTDSVLATVSTEADSSELFRVADRLTANLLAESRLSHRVDRLQRLAAQTTDSLEALKLFLSGSGALRRGEYARAAALFAQAVEIDTTFALAYFRLAIASEWNIQYDRARTAVEQALAHSGRLPHSERLMAEALDAYLNGRAREAEAQLERAITARPEDTEAWFRLAELRFHFFAVRDHPIEDSYQAWQNVISADSNNMSALVHLVRIAALRADSATVDRLAARIRAASPAADRLWEVRALQAFVGGRPAAEDALLAEMRAAGDSALLLGFGISGFTDNVEGAHRLAVALNASADREMRKLALAKLAELELVSGRPAAADAWLIQLGALDSNVALMLRAYFATLPGLQRKTPVLVSIAADLERWRADLIPPSTAVGPMQAFSTLPSVMPQLHRYLQGRVAARLGRWAEVQLAESRLRVLRGPPHATALGEDLAVSLAAMHALGRGDSAGAAALLATLRMETPVELLNSSWFYSLYAEQFERAALAEWSGRPDLALETYAAVRHSRVLAAPAAFAIAGIHHRSGNRSAAIREYRRGLALWSSPEASALPLVNRARKRLREIEARPDLPRERTPTGGRQAGRSGEVDGAS